VAIKQLLGAVLKAIQNRSQEYGYQLSSSLENYIQNNVYVVHIVPQFNLGESRKTIKL
jgi:hypothetical protein